MGEGHDEAGALEQSLTGELNRPIIYKHERYASGGIRSRVRCARVAAPLSAHRHLSGGYLALSTMLAVIQAVVSWHLSQSEEVKRLFYAKDIDRAWDRYVPLLGLAEFAVFFEYAHWRPLPQLVAFPIQIAGLMLCAAGTIWLLWVDSYLIHEFPSHYKRDLIMTSGPYRFVRHPRYSGLFATRLALPLIFGSVAGWIIALVWLILIRRRARLEERFLTGKFGRLYTEYATHVIGIP